MEEKQYIDQVKVHDDLYYISADTLTSTLEYTDTKAYNFRSSAQSVDIGKTISDKIVGGSIVWNQRKNIVSGTTTAPSFTVYNTTNTAKTNTDTYTRATVKVNKTGYAGGMYESYSGIGGHRLLIRYKARSNKNVTVGINYGSSTNYLTTALTAGEWSERWGIMSMASTETRMWFSYTTALEVDDYVDWSEIMIFNLTQMFGSEIADYLYSLRNETGNPGVTWFRNLFPNPYYQYNKGTLLSVCTNAHIMRGFNALDEVWEVGEISADTGLNQDNASILRTTNYIKVLPNTTYYFSVQPGHYMSYPRARFYRADKSYIGTADASGQSLAKNTTFVTPADAYYVRFAPSDYGTTYTNDICVNLSWTGYRNGEYESYVEHCYPLSPIELRGVPKLDSGNNLCFDGDTYEYDGTVTRNYEYRAYQSGDESLPDAITDGTHTVIKLLVPTTETATPFADPQTVDDFGTEEYVDAKYEAGERDVAIPVGHETTYLTVNLKDKLQRLPGPVTEDGTYVVVYDGASCTLQSYQRPYVQNKELVFIKYNN